METNREDIISFIRDHHKETDEAPTLREITEKFSMSSKTFYGFFSGLAEACRASGVPVPEKRRDTTAEATKAIQRSARSRDRAGPGSSDLVVLTQEQVGRLLGLSHIEGGKDPRVVLDEILDRDSKVRALLDKPEDLGRIIEILGRFVEAKVPLQELPDVLGRLWRLGILNYSREALEGLAEIVTSLKIRGLKIDDFVRDASDAESSLHWYFKYRQGEITAAQYAVKVGVHI